MSTLENEMVVKRETIIGFIDLLKTFEKKVRLMMLLVIVVLILNKIKLTYSNVNHLLTGRVAY